MTVLNEINATSTAAVQARHLGLVPGLDQLMVGAAKELAEHGGLLPASTRDVLHGFMVMAMLVKMEQP